MDEPERLKEDEPKQNPPKDEGLPNGCYLAFCVVFLIAMLSMCVRGCDGGGGGDVWDDLDHSVKTDPYYKQWD